MSIEAMKQALEALERGRPQIVGVLVQQDQDAAITALRQAIEQAEKQEPVANSLDWWALFDENQRLRAELKFNTAPPKREWVGLTDEEREQLILGNVENVTVAEAAMFKTVLALQEAKLREKNT